MKFNVDIFSKLLKFGSEMDQMVSFAETDYEIIDQSQYSIYGETVPDNLMYLHERIHEEVRYIIFKRGVL